MEFFISRNNQQFGPYTAAQVEQFIEEKRLALSDLAWRTGVQSWAPLGDLLPSRTPTTGATGEAWQFFDENRRLVFTSADIPAIRAKLISGEIGYWWWCRKGNGEAGPIHRVLALEEPSINILFRPVMGHARMYREKSGSAAAVIGFLTGLGYVLTQKNVSFWFAVKWVIATTFAVTFIAAYVGAFVGLFKTKLPIR